MQTDSVQVRFTYEQHGPNFLGCAEIPTSNGVIKFKTLIPMADVRMQVRRFLAAQPEVSGDPNIAARVAGIESAVAQERAKRKLITAIRIRRGLPVSPADVSGPAYRPQQLALIARNRSMYQSGIAGSDDPYADVGAFGFLKKAVKGIGKGVKAVGKGVGKGTVAVAKGVGKGTVAVAKGVGKGTVVVAKATGKTVSAVARNPITAALLTTVPGGAAALAIVNAAKGGQKGAQEAITDISAGAAAGDPNAQASAAALQAAAQQSGGTSMTPWLIGAGALAAVGGIFLASRSKAS